MSLPKLTRTELRILNVLWSKERAAVREILEALPEPRPAYTTVQTIINRLEVKHAVRRVRKIGNAHIYEPAVPREAARRKLLDEILSFFGGRAQPMMAQLAEAGKLTRKDIRELEETMDRIEREKRAERTSKP